MKAVAGLLESGEALLSESVGTQRVIPQGHQSPGVSLTTVGVVRGKTVECFLDQKLVVTPVGVGRHVLARGCKCSQQIVRQTLE